MINQDSNLPDVDEDAIRRLREGQSVNSVLRTLCDVIIDTLSVSGVGIFLIDRQPGMLHGRMGVPDEVDKLLGKVGVSIDDPHSVNAVAARTKSPVVVDDAENDDRTKKWLVNVFHIKSVIIVPILHDNQVLGTVDIAEQKRLRRFTEAEVTAAAILANAAGDRLSKLVTD